MEPVRILILIFGILLSVLVIVAGVKLSSDRRLVKTILIVAGVFGISAVLFFAVSASIGGRDDAVFLAGVSEDQVFNLSLEHERLYFDGGNYHFTSDKNWAELVAELERQYPQGETTSDATWELRSAEIPVEVRADLQAQNQYVASRQVATVGAANAEGGVEFAYPRGDSSSVQFEEGVAIRGLEHSNLLDYYESLKGAEIAGEEIVIPASNGFVSLKLGEDSVSFTRVN